MGVELNATTATEKNPPLEPVEKKQEGRSTEVEKAETNGKKDQSKSSRKHSMPIAKPDLPQKSWKIEDSEALYRIEGWGQPYFSINAAGHVTVSPKGDRGGSLDLFELVNALKQRNLGLPLLIRFSDILEDRIERLNACFRQSDRPLQLLWCLSWRFSG
jgi:arginine decarboxylase